MLAKDNRQLNTSGGQLNDSMPGTNSELLNAYKGYRKLNASEGLVTELVPVVWNRLVRKKHQTLKHAAGFQSRGSIRRLFCAERARSLFSPPSVSPSQREK